MLPTTKGYCCNWHCSYFHFSRRILFLSSIGALSFKLFNRHTFFMKYPRHFVFKQQEWELASMIKVHDEMRVIVKFSDDKYCMPCEISKEYILHSRRYNSRSLCKRKSLNHTVQYFFILGPLKNH